jgi:regulator of replication initiation timing
MTIQDAINAIENDIESIAVRINELRAKVAEYIHQSDVAAIVRESNRLKDELARYKTPCVDNITCHQTGSPDEPRD